MPPGKKLPDEQIAALRAWIEDGAPMPVAKVSASKEDEEAKAALAKMEDRPISAEERQYWAFRAPVRPVVPTVVAANPIDAFLRQAMQSKRVKPSPPTDKRTLIRRAYLDMTGLPPTIDQVNAFVNDSSPKAFSKVVEDLLASPHYGERWGRHWLDVVRYADSGGFEYDRDRPTAWQYRDYVIRSFNEDKPYDRFVKSRSPAMRFGRTLRMLGSPRGYLRLGLENNLKNEQTRLDELDDLVTTTSNAFLGVTVGCARCHNHKFDPIPQKDYYRIQAVFFPAKPLEYPLVSAEEMTSLKQEQKRIDGLQAPWKDKIKATRAAVSRSPDGREEGEATRLHPACASHSSREADRGPEAERNQVEKTLSIEAKELYCRAFAGRQGPRHDELTAKVKELERERPDPYAVGDVSHGTRARCHAVVLPASRQSGAEGQRDEARRPCRRQPLRFVSSGAAGRRDYQLAPTRVRRMACLDREPTDRARDGQSHLAASLRRRYRADTRATSARWASVRRIPNCWTGSLPSSSEGLEHQSHPSFDSELRNVSDGIDDIAANVAIDRDNKFLWRMPRRRLEGEALRDSIMAVAGNLDRTVGGPAVHPYIDPALFQSSSKRTWVGKPDSDPSTWRRSVYVFSKRSIPLPMLEVFDKPDSVGSCARRNRSTIAPQALILMNNSFVLMEAKNFADRLRKEAGADPTSKSTWRSSLRSAASLPQETRAIGIFSAQPATRSSADFCQAMHQPERVRVYPMSKRFLSRREMLQATGGGIASLAFSHLVSAATSI